MADGNATQPAPPLDLFSSTGSEPAGLQPADNRTHLLALSLVDGLGGATIRQLYERFSDLAQVWEESEAALTDVLRAAKLPGANRVARTVRESRGRLLDQARHDQEVLQSRGISILLDTDGHFPERLKVLPSAPRWLFVQGAIDHLHRLSSVAVVGTREASHIGVCLSRAVSEHLVEWGYVIVSGLADGIDAAAHQMAVDLAGDTVAVLGTGIDIEFPAENTRLRARILEAGGTLVTEYFPSATYSRQSFVQRNRIQAGLASVVIPVESKARSGTAHTVRFAEEYGRPVVGVWDHRRPLSDGSEMLMRLSAKNYTIFDLGSESGLRRLRDFLLQFGADARAQEIVPETLWRSSYGPALRHLYWAVMCRRPDEPGAEWILDRVKQILGRDDGDKGSLLRS